GTPGARRRRSGSAAAIRIGATARPRRGGGCSPTSRAGAEEGATMRKVHARRSARTAPGPPAAWTQLPLQEPPPPEPPPPAPPAAGEWIDALVADLAIELGDAARTAAHQATARDLWRRSGLPEGEFATVLLAVRAQAKRWTGRP